MVTGEQRGAVSMVDLTSTDVLLLLIWVFLLLRFGES